MTCRPSRVPDVLADVCTFVAVAAVGAVLVLTAMQSCAPQRPAIRQLPALADLACLVIRALPSSSSVDVAVRACNAWDAGKADPREVLDAAEACQREIRAASEGIEPSHP